MILIGLPVHPFGKDIPKRVQTVGAMSRIKTASSETPFLILFPQKIRGTCVS